MDVFVLVPVPSYEQHLVCPKCGAHVSAVSKFCSFCGAPLQLQAVLKICPRCKNRIPETARFCPECGQKQEPA